MLVVQSMGSHGGQQNFPFGYIPNELHGIGLPDFMTPGPPPGQPLLSEHDTQNLDSFLNGFDANGDQNKDGTVQQFQGNMDAGHEWMMPPTFVGSETSLGPRNGADWQNFQMTDFTFGNEMNMATMNPPQEYQNNMHGHGFATNGHYDHNLLHQLHNAAQTVQQPFNHGWQPGFQPQLAPQMQQPPRPTMRFGSDSHFQPSGYAPPDSQFDHTATPSMDWLEAHSSAPGTQPNTEPNTQPSSPNWPKKRKLDDYQAESRRNGYGSNLNGGSGRPQLTPTSSTSNTKTFFNQEQLSTPTSRIPPKFQQENDDVIEDEDADYDEDDGPQSHTPSASPSNHLKTKSAKPTVKSSRTRKKSTASNTPSRPKLKGSRSSTGGPPASRTPLTADQKKANHTNSEQRRRDATARAYAELYDLVPELEEVGKQSTMKKLEIVVSKVRKVKARVQALRATLGFDVDTGLPLQQGNSLSPGTMRNVGGNLASDMTSWSR